MKLLGQLDRMLLAELARLFFATLLGVVLLYLVIDFADGGSGLRQPGNWVRAAGELYANKAAVVAYQLAPAALIISTTLLISQLQRRGELIALHALGVGPLRLALPLLGFAALLSIGMVWIEEAVVVRADARAEQIAVGVFHRWGTFGDYNTERSWVKGGAGHLFHLGRLRDGGFSPATVLEVVPPFRLARRIDARRMEPAGPGRWRLLDAVETRYLPALEERRSPEQLESFAETSADLALRGGRPRQMPWGELLEQAALREKAGQPSREYRVAVSERATWPLQCAPAALAALGLSLATGRRARRRSLAAAVAMGIGFTLVLWAASVVLHSAAMSGTIPPWPAAFGPTALCVAAGLALLLPGELSRK